MILQWNAGAAQQLHQGGFAAFNWSGSTSAPAPVVRPDYGARIIERDLRKDVEDRIKRETEEDAAALAGMEAAIRERVLGAPEFEEALTAAEPELLGLVARLAQTLDRAGPLTEPQVAAVKARIEMKRAARGHVDLADDEVAAILMMVD